MVKKVSNTISGLSESRKSLVDTIIDSLNQGIIPWQKPWNHPSSFQAPINAITNSKYSGINNFYLTMHSISKGYDDPRWLTFNQAKQNDYQVMKGERGVKIECWKLYNKQTGKNMNWFDYVSLSQNERDEISDVLSWRNYPAVVFNATQVKGIPEMEKNEVNDGINKVMTEPQFEKITNNLIERLNLKTDFDAPLACYIPSEDKLCMPKSEYFIDTQYYYSVMLHEIGHSTGHESRMNRNQKFGFGTKEYAKEELRAEISSMFLSQEINIKMSNEHIGNHQAYIQNWISELKNDPNELFKAIKDGQKICDYLIEKGDINNIKEKGNEYTTMNNHDLNQNDCYQPMNKTASNVIEESKEMENYDFEMM